MKVKHVIRVLVVLSVLSGITLAQEQTIPDTLFITEPDLESILENATQDAEDSELIDLLSRLEENPSDLNSASKEDLEQIPGIDAIIALNIIEYRTQQKFRSVDDLNKVDGVTPELFSLTVRFVTVRDVESLWHSFGVGAVRFRSRSQQDLQKRRGFEDGTFQGSPLKLYNRLMVRSTPMQFFREGKGTTAEIGILTEKDAGEKRLVDYLAGYVDLRNLGPVTRLIIGDYSVEAAHGMVLWRSISFGKGSDVLQPFRKSGSGIRPYLSTEENFYFRGLATIVSFSRVNLSLMYSDKPLHATVNSDGTLTSFYSGGLFRTESEMRRKNSTREQFLGGRVTFDVKKGMHIGATGYSARFDHPISLSGTFGMTGLTTSMGSVDASYTDKKMSVFTEIARDHDGTMAGVLGVLFRPIRGFNVVLVGREYPKDFMSFHGNGFGETDGTQNERGFYMGTRFRATSWLQLSAYYDHFRFPWRTSLIRMPSDGNDFLSLAEMTLTRKIKLSLQYKEKEKGISEIGIDNLGRDARIVGMRKQTNYRMTLDYTPSITLRWRTRVEVVDVNYSNSQKKEDGILLYQDIRIHPLSKLLVYIRLAIFHTDSYDSRVYQYESDVQGTFSNPALFGKGIRSYVTSRYEITRNIDIWFRYAVTIKDGVKSLSSGSSEILRDLDNRLTLQLDVEF